VPRVTGHLEIFDVHAAGVIRPRFPGVLVRVPRAVRLTVFERFPCAKRTIPNTIDHRRRRYDGTGAPGNRRTRMTGRNPSRRFNRRISFGRLFPSGPTLGNRIPAVSTVTVNVPLAAITLFTARCSGTPLYVHS